MDFVILLNTMTWASAATGTAIALALSGALDKDGFPSPEAWNYAQPIRFDADWQGRNADPLRETEVRLLWTNETLFLRFRCSYRSLTTFSDSDPDGRRYQLWDRDVAEVFLQPDPSEPHRYWEFEVSPNGKWIDLDITLDKPPGHPANPRSGMKSRVHFDERERIWTAEIALPMRTLAPAFEAKTDWRVNFFRVEGPTEPRFYSSWQPTNTPQPNFHVPEAFGKLSFR
jgi:alpha-galactosidase